MVYSNKQHNTPRSTKSIHEAIPIPFLFTVAPSNTEYYMLPKKYPGSYPILPFSNKFPQDQAFALTPPRSPTKSFLIKFCLVIDRPCAHPFFAFIPTNNSNKGGKRGRGVGNRRGRAWVSDSEAGAANSFLGKKKKKNAPEL